MSFINSAVATHSVVGTSFGFYSADEIRRLSVKQIVVSTALNRLEAPVLGGLYDPAMGPIDRDAMYGKISNIALLLPLIYMKNKFKLSEFAYVDNYTNN